jgi:integrase
MESNNQSQLQEKQIISSILTEEISKAGVEKIIEALQMKKYIISAVLPQTPESEPFAHFLERFWDYNKSPYVREKLVVGQSIHRRYTDIMKSRALAYWAPLLGKKPVGSITKADIKKGMWIFATQQQAIRTSKKDANGNRIYVQKAIASETINQVVRSATCALKWAYHNGLTKNDCFSGLVFCHVISKKRQILTMDQAREVFEYNWKKNSCRLANLISMCTGMRIGEIQALQIQDIAADRIYVRHNWARGDGLKSPKNGTVREVKIPKALYTLISQQIADNPYNHTPDSFIFYSDVPNLPRGCRQWNEALHVVLKELHISNYRDITFHSWRHFFTTNMADHVDERKLQLATGHKTLNMLEHYAAHESQQTLDELGVISEALFLPFINT